MIFWKKSKKQVAVKKTSKPVPQKEPSQSEKNPKPSPPPKPKSDIPRKPAKEPEHLDAQKEFLRVFKQLTNHHRAWDIWRDFVTMFACTISNELDKVHYDEREKMYLRIIKKYSKSEQILFPELVAYTVMALEENSEQDFLGGIFMNLGLGNGSNGQFFTPYHVCDLMAKIAMGDGVVIEVKEKGYITINDSCCGAGATLIAGIHEARRQLEKADMNFQNHVLIVAQDVDMIVALMCYIQISLLGVAGFIKVGNTFTEPICEGDSTKNYWFTPMYFSDIWRMRRIFHQIDEIMKGEK